MRHFGHHGPTHHVAWIFLCLPVVASQSHDTTSQHGAFLIVRSPDKNDEKLNSGTHSAAGQRQAADAPAGVPVTSPLPTRQGNETDNPAAQRQATTAPADMPASLRGSPVTSPSPTTRISSSNSETRIPLPAQSATTPSGVTHRSTKSEEAQSQTKVTTTTKRETTTRKPLWDLDLRPDRAPTTTTSTTTETLLESLVLMSLATCDSLACPTGFEYRRHAYKQQCSALTCSLAVDLHTCCQRKVRWWMNMLVALSFFCFLSMLCGFLGGLQHFCQRSTRRRRTAVRVSKSRGREGIGSEGHELLDDTKDDSDTSS